MHAGLFTTITLVREEQSIENTGPTYRMDLMKKPRDLAKKKLLFPKENAMVQIIICIKHQVTIFQILIRRHGLAESDLAATME